MKVLVIGDGMINAEEIAEAAGKLKIETRSLVSWQRSIEDQVALAYPR